MIQIKNSILTTVFNLEKLNIQLCNMVSNINNIKFVCNKKCDAINESLWLWKNINVWIELIIIQEIIISFYFLSNISNVNFRFPLSFLFSTSITFSTSCNVTCILPLSFKILYHLFSIRWRLVFTHLRSEAVSSS